MTTDDSLLAAASKYLPGGSTWMWSLPADVRFVVERGEGGRIIDTAGKSYVDYVLGSGPLLLGHAPAAVVRAVQAQVAKGSQYHWLSESTIRLAERLVDAVPCAEKIRFVSTGTEATMLAIRMARVFTQREKVLKFEGGWHGLHDYAMVGNWHTGEAPYPSAVPDVGGIPKGAIDSMLVAPFNDQRVLEDVFETHGQEIAAVIVEPMQRAIVPAPGFLALLRTVTQRHRAVLIFDEVVTGFRLAYGGAQEYYGVTPDLATYGKALTCGYSLGAIAGHAAIMDTADPARKGGSDYACLSGTLSGNPIACAAGLAALAELRRPGVYDRLHAVGQRLRTDFAAIAARRGIAMQALGDGPIVQPVFVDPARVIRGDHDLKDADGKRAVRLGHELIRRGVFVIPGAKMYLSYAHTDADLDHTVRAFDESLAALG